MNEVLTTKLFEKWLSRLDRPIRHRVFMAIDKMKLGNLGDHKRLNEDVYETRIHIPSGIRLYYMWRGLEIILMIGGGNKDSQKKDIQTAFETAEQIKKEEVYEQEND